MRPKVVFAVAIIVSLLAGGLASYFLIDAITKIQIPNEVKALAARVKVQIPDNGLEYTMGIDSPVVRVIFWQSGGVLLAEDVWVDAAWQIVLGGEDKPTSSLQGDKADIVLKIQKTAATGQVWFEVFCGGDYIKRVFFDDVLKLDTSSGNRRVRW